MASGDSTRANLAIFESVNLLEGHMWDQMSLFGKAPLLRNIVWRVLKLKYCRQAARYWNQESSWALDKISHTSQSPSTTYLPRHVHDQLSNQNIWRSQIRSNQNLAATKSFDSPEIRGFAFCWNCKTSNFRNCSSPKPTTISGPPSSASPLQSHKSTISFPPSHPVALLSILIAKNLHSVFPQAWPVINVGQRKTLQECESQFW